MLSADLRLFMYLSRYFHHRMLTIHRDFQVLLHSGKPRYHLGQRKCPSRPFTPEEFENVVLFLRLGLPSTLIGNQHGAFRKQSQTGGNQKRRLCVLVWKENILKMELFKDNEVTIIMIFPCMPELNSNHE